MKKTSFPDSATQAASEKARPTEEIARLVRDCVSEIAVHPIPEVRATSIIDGVIELTISPEPGDVKRLIGTNGAHINSVRRICQLWGDANGQSVTVPDFNAPPDHSDRYDKFQHEPDWPKDRVVGALQRMVEAIARRPVQVQTVDSDQQTYVVFRYDRDTNAGKMAALQSPLSILGNAMGKKNGRALAVHIRAESLVRNATRR